MELISCLPTTCIRGMLLDWRSNPNQGGPTTRSVLASLAAQLSRAVSVGHLSNCVCTGPVRHL